MPGSVPADGTEVLEADAIAANALSTTALALGGLSAGTLGAGVLERAVVEVAATRAARAKKDRGLTGPNLVLPTDPTHMVPNAYGPVKVARLQIPTILG
jgi:hypothetical protein